MGVCWGQSPQLSVCPTVESWQPQKPEIRAAPALSPALKSKHAHWHWLPAPLNQKPHGGAHPHRRSHAGAATVSIHTGARVLAWRPRRFMVVGDISLPMVSTRCRPVKERTGSNGQTAVELCGQPREHRLAGEAARCGVHGMAAGVRAWHAKRATAACGHSPASSAPLAASPNHSPWLGMAPLGAEPSPAPDMPGGSTCRTVVGNIERSAALRMTRGSSCMHSRHQQCSRCHIYRASLAQWQLVLLGPDAPRTSRQNDPAFLCFLHHHKHKLKLNATSHNSPSASAAWLGWRSRCRSCGTLLLASPGPPPGPGLSGWASRPGGSPC